MIDYEALIAIPNLRMRGVSARYQSAKDGEPDGEIDLTVIFHRGYVSVDALGNEIDDVQASAIGARSALSDAKRGGLLTVDGDVFLVRSKPQDDGVVWIKLMLEGPINAAG